MQPCRKDTFDPVGPSFPQSGADSEFNVIAGSRPRRKNSLRAYNDQRDGGAPTTTRALFPPDDGADAGEVRVVSNP